jgi:hypothetical protein
MAFAGTMFRLAEHLVGSHYWLVISEPLSGKVLCVNITDGMNCPDSPCHLSIGEHSCITKPSAIVYRRAREFSAEIIAAEKNNPRDLEFFDDASPAMLSRIIAGAKIADDLTARLLDYLR